MKKRTIPQTMIILGDYARMLRNGEYEAFCAKERESLELLAEFMEAMAEDSQRKGHAPTIKSLWRKLREVVWDWEVREASFEPGSPQKRAADLYTKRLCQFITQMESYYPEECSEEALKWAKKAFSGVDEEEAPKKRRGFRKPEPMDTPEWRQAFPRLKDRELIEELPEGRLRWKGSKAKFAFAMRAIYKGKGFPQKEISQKFENLTESQIENAIKDERKRNNPKKPSPKPRPWEEDIFREIFPEKFRENGGKAK